MACAQPLSGEFSSRECSNDIDDDGDSLVDCADPDCAAWIHCSAQFLKLQAIDGGQGRRQGEPVDTPNTTDGGGSGGNGENCNGEPCDAGLPKGTFALRATEAIVPGAVGGRCLDLCTPGFEFTCNCDPDPYVLIMFDGAERWRSEVVMDKRHATWSTEGTAALTLVLVPEDDGRMELIVMDYDEGDVPDDLLGPQTDDEIFRCKPSLKWLNSGYLGCSQPEGSEDQWVRVEMIPLSQ